MRTRLMALPLGLLLLTGCSSSPQAEVRQDVRAVLAAANDEDADAVRSAVDDLLSTLREQVGSQELTDAEAAPVRDAALAIRESVAELDAEPTPTPTPPPSEEPPPSPTPSPTPSQTPTPSPTPAPTEEPEETEPPETTEPEETEEPEAPDDGGDGEGDGEGDDQATVVPQQPAFTTTPGPTPTA